jgi:hypothetical protein
MKVYFLAYLMKVYKDKPSSGRLKDKPSSGRLKDKPSSGRLKDKPSSGRLNLSLSLIDEGYR